MMRILTAGESHGPELTAIIEGVPAGLFLSAEEINQDLRRRQGGYGRGQRMQIENDQVKITSGVRHGKTLGSPITLRVLNRDFSHWQEVMATTPLDQEKLEGARRVTKPRPGHADLVGGIKYGFKDLRNVLERSSARETAMRVAAGSIAKKILSQLGIRIANHVINFGGFKIDVPQDLTVGQILDKAEKNDLSIVADGQGDQIRAYIDQIKKEGDTLGGVVEVRVENLPTGLGSYVQADRKLDAKIAAAVISINAFKGVEFGLGFETANLRGSEVMDEISWKTDRGYFRKSNRLGGFEGGMTTGEQVIVRGVMKPIPTLYKPLMSVDIESHQPYKAQVERSDPTALPAAGVVMEAVVATVLAQELCDQFESDTMSDMIDGVEAYRKRVGSY